jgi:glyoxylase-like metal-dependent hydrolase (beta-lactamase superfamily II)
MTLLQHQSPVANADIYLATTRGGWKRFHAPEKWSLAVTGALLFSGDAVHIKAN